MHRDRSKEAAKLEDARAAYERSDYILALRLCLPLANKGIAEAQDMVGNFYAQNLDNAPNQDISHDYATAVIWYQKAAEQGYAPAASALGSMYHIGLGVPQDYRIALTWLRKAANQGHWDAQFLLAEMYEKGEGVPQDFVTAYMWYDLAVTQASFDRATIRRDGVAHKMTAEQVIRAQELSREWKATKQR